MKTRITLTPVKLLKLLGDPGTTRTCDLLLRRRNHPHSKRQVSYIQLDPSKSIRITFILGQGWDRNKNTYSTQLGRILAYRFFKPKYRASPDSLFISHQDNIQKLNNMKTTRGSLWQNDFSTRGYGIRSGLENYP